MKKLIDCGSFLICIEGCKEILGCFHPKWEYSLSDETKCPDIILHLQEGIDNEAENHEDGWWNYSQYGFHEERYIQKGKQIFSLCYGSSVEELTVRIDQYIGNHLRIGIHYGLMLALHKKCISLHGVTVLCKNEIIILSAKSGTGKTTLGKLLEQHCDAVIINGDFALLNPTGDYVVFEPTPFCGTSGRCLNHRFRINRIVFLGQAKKNIWRKLDGREAIVRFMSNAFVPTWDSSMQEAVQDNILKCISMLKINSFDFEPTKDAADIFLENVQEGASLNFE